MRTLSEISRETYGHDCRAINKHHDRRFQDEKGRLYLLSKTMDGCPPFFEAYGPFKKGYVGLLPRLKVNGQEYWGGGWSWAKALKAFCRVVCAKDRKEADTMKERLYELSLEIAGYDRNKEDDIKRVCSVEWPFMTVDFVRIKVPGSRYRVMQACALGTLFEVEDIDEVTKRMERVIWHANGELCHVACKTKQIIKIQDCVISLDYVEDALVG